MEDRATDSNIKFPTRLVRKQDKQKVLDMMPQRVSNGSHELILAEIARRARIDFEENTVVRLGPTQQEEQEAGDEEEESDEELD